jgi:vancomycin permeability regulator SanA
MNPHSATAAEEEIIINKYLRYRIAAAAFPLDKGRVVLLGFGVKNRAQSYGTFKLLFDALFY